MALTNKLIAIANAIRAKTGKSDTMTMTQMVTEIENLSGGFDNEITFNAINSTAQSYLTASSSYVANDFTTSVASNYSSTTTRHDLPNEQTITLPSASATLYLCDSVTGRTIKKATSGSTYSLKNLIPNRTYFIYFLNASGDLLKASRFKATGALRMINANSGSDGLGTFNIRDIGGWSCDGGSIAYGKVFRGGQLNYANAQSTLNSDEKAIFKDFLGIRDEIDLRTDDFVHSALGEDVDYLYVPVSPYANGIDLSNNTQTNYYKTLLKRVVFDVVNNKPCYIHCAEGADRTGTLICLIEALCGVGQTDIDRDYELTSLSQNRLRERTGSSWKALMTYINGLVVEETSFRDKVLYYTLQAGVTIDEVNALRQNLIDGTPEIIINPFQTVYSITSTISAHTYISNNATTINEGDSYLADVTADPDYSANVTITMGGTDITSTAYNNGRIDIADVTGDLVITISETYTGNLFDASAATLQARIRSNGETTSGGDTQNLQLVTDFIPATKTNIFYLTSDKTQNINAYTGMMALYNSSKTHLGQYGRSITGIYTWDSDYKNGTCTLSNIPSPTFNLNDIAYIRFCISYTDINNIVIQKSSV